MKQTKKPFNVLSDIRCQCGAKIKQNLVDRKPAGTILDCFKCTQAAAKGSDNPIVTAHDVKAGKIPGRAFRLFKDGRKTYLPRLAG